MKQAWKGIAGTVLCLGLASHAAAQNVLDDMIYSVKCAGADDKEACKAKARQDFEDHQRSKQQGNSTAPGETSAARTEKCQSVSANGPADVDTAYARAVSTFGFQSHEEKTHHGQYKVVTDEQYKHARTPGALYDLWDRVYLAWPERNRTARFYAGAKLLKNGSGSTVSARYCVISGDDPGYSDPAFWQFADESFRKLVQ